MPLPKPQPPSLHHRTLTTTRRTRNSPASPKPSSSDPPSDQTTSSTGVKSSFLNTSNTKIPGPRLRPQVSHTAPRNDFDNLNVKSGSKGGIKSGSNLKPQNYFDKKDGFERQASHLLNLINTSAKRDLIAHNPHINKVETYLSITNKALEIGVGSIADGKYYVEVNTDDKCIDVTSLISGRNTYVFVVSDSSPPESEESGGVLKGNWRNVTDGHDMIGILTRDMLRSCGGCLNV